MKGWRYLIGGPHAISVAAWLSSLPWTVWLALAFNADLTQPTLLAWLGVALASHLVLGLVLAVASWTWLTASRTDTHPGRALVTFALAGAAQAGATEAAGILLGLVTEPALAYRITVGVALTTAWLAIVTALIASRAQQRQATAELRRRRHQLGVLRNDPPRALELWRATTLEEARRRVGQELARVRRVAGSGPADDATAARATQQLEAIIDEVVRPLCRQLASNGEVVPVASVGLDEPDDIAVSEGLPPETWRDHLRTFVEDTTAARPVARLPIPLASAVVVAFWFAAAAAGGAVASQIPGVPLDPERLMGVSTASFAALLALGVSLAAMHRTYERTGHRVRAIMTELDIAIARLRRRARAEQRSLARLVHCEIQTRIVATTLQIGRPRAPNPRVLLDNLKDGCDRALTGGGTTSDLTARLRGFADQWRGVMTTTVERDPAAFAALERDQPASDRVLTIVQEALLNAAQHGRATTATVTIRVSDGAAHLTIRDDGNAPVGDFRPGIGTQLFDELASSWRLTDLGDGRQLEAEVPLGQD